ncbi:unnamed protein product, partial [Ixodes hexagonus]
MLDKKWQRLKNYSAHVSRFFPGELTAQEIYASLRNTKSALSKRGVDYDQPCTQSETQYCHILDDLSFWNEFMWLCYMEIKEVAPGELGTDCLVGFTPVVASEDMCRHAHILLHWLLKEHRCIKALKVKGVVARRNPRLFFDALRLNNGLRRLELRECNLEAKCKTCVEDGSQHLVAAIGTLVGLEELILYDVHMSEKALVLLGIAFENMPCLRSFSAILGYMSAPKTSILVQSLKRGKKIKTLHCNEWCLCHEGTAFAKYLAEHEVLEELVIEYGTGELESVLEALATNRALRKLHLIGYFKPFQGPLLSKMMAANNTVQSFHTSGGKCTFEGDSLAEIIRNNTGLLELDMQNVAALDGEQLALAIRINATMKKLSLRWSELSLEDTSKFCEALADNSSLQIVTAESVKEELVTDVYKVLRETGTEQRMKFKSVIKSATALQDALLNCHEITEVLYHPTSRSLAGGFAGAWNALFSTYTDDEQDSDDEPYPHEHRHFQKASDTPAPELYGLSCLTLCSHLVKLQVTLEDIMHESCAELLAQVLRTTKTLRHADLNFPTTFSTTQVLLDAISLNRTITTLIVSCWCFLAYHAGDFADTLGRNKTLNYLELHDTNADLILQELSSTVASNKFLVSIKIDDNLCLDDELWMFEIMDVLRRNFSLLERAVRFVMGKHDKRCGEAFEQVSQSVALSERVQQLAGESESDAEERIRTSRRYLNTNFLAVAGVVNDSVVCEGGSEGQTQLDQIGLDNWLRVRSYLDLTDIKDTP